jgi:excisionase family DNA binding protein
MLKHRKWVTMSEVTEILGISPPTVRKLVKEGRLSALRTPGGHMRFPSDAIARYLGAIESPTPPEQKAAS